MADFCGKMEYSGEMANGYVNRWWKAFGRHENGGNGGFLRLTGSRRTRETRGGDGFVSAQESARSVRVVFS